MADTVLAWCPGNPGRVMALIYHDRTYTLAVVFSDSEPDMKRDHKRYVAGFYAPTIAKRAAWVKKLKPYPTLLKAFTAHEKGQP